MGRKTMDNLSTFTNCVRPTAPIMVIHLAKNFRYEHDHNQVRCTRCQWSHDITLVTPTKLKCPHLRSFKKNSSLTREEQTKTTLIKDVKEQQSEQPPPEEQWNGIPGGLPGGVDDVRFVNTATRGTTQCKKVIFPDENNLDDVTTYRTVQNLTVSQVQLQEQHNRLYTFTHWPEAAPVSGADLAEAGFYYIGPGDRVKCAYCYKRLKNWTSGDDAWLEHQRLAPFCKFVAGHLDHLQIKNMDWK